MTPTDQVPEYRVLVKSFFAPDVIEPGSKIRYSGVPGNHLEPLNEAAEAAMEDWYDMEVEEVDPRTGKKTGQKVKPHAGFRRYVREDIAEHDMQLMSLPDADDDTTTIQTLGEIMNARKSTSQRPPPEAARKAKPPEPKAAP